MKIKKLLFICFALLFAFILVSCETDDDITPTPDTSTSITTTAGKAETPEPTQPEKDPLLGLPLLANANKITKGMSENDVIELIGKQESIDHDAYWQGYYYKRWDLINGYYAFISFNDSKVEKISIHLKKKNYDCQGDVTPGTTAHALSHLAGECISSFYDLYGTCVLNLPDDDYLIVYMDSEGKVVEKAVRRNYNDRISANDVERANAGMTFKEMYDAFGKPYSSGDNYYIWRTDIVEYEWQYGIIYKNLIVITSNYTFDGIIGGEDINPDTVVFIGYEADVLTWEEASELFCGLNDGTLKLKDIVEKTGYQGIILMSGNITTYSWVIQGGGSLTVRLHAGGHYSFWIDSPTELQ